LGLHERIADVNVYDVYASTGYSLNHLNYVELYLHIYQLQVVSFPSVIHQYGKLEIIIMNDELHGCCSPIVEYGLA